MPRDREGKLPDYEGGHRVPREFREPTRWGGQHARPSRPMRDKGPATRPMRDKGRPTRPVNGDKQGGCGIVVAQAGIAMTVTGLLLKFGIKSARHRRTG